MTAAAAVDVRDMSFAWPGNPVPVLHVAAFALRPGGQLALMGPSGSGKSTFLAILAGLLRPTTGVVTVAGQRLDLLNEEDCDRWRARQVGVVFQQGHLLGGATVAENLGIAQRYALGAEDPQAIAETLDAVGMRSAAHRRPSALSVGEQQRVVVARAMVHRPSLLLADEPTAALDQPNAMKMMTWLLQRCAERGTALIVVTHQPEIAALLPEVRSLADINRAAR